MNELWIATLGASAICYLLKILGYSLPESTLNNPRIQRVNTFIPIVLLSALVAVQTLTIDSEVVVDHRLIGVLVAAIALKMRVSFPIMMISAALSSALVYNFV
ncbi:MAG: AzlD domain-containing protein [Actinobacteria bacterium]|nr:AzlD domain-containing protein [Actinomycetota bacterium]